MSELKIIKKINTKENAETVQRYPEKTPDLCIIKEINVSRNPNLHIMKSVQSCAVSFPLCLISTASGVGGDIIIIDVMGL